MFSRGPQVTWTVSVQNTSIFARGTDDGHQYLVYSMRVQSGGDVAMILPLPVPPGPGDEAVRFIDLQGYPKFFDDMARAFPEEMEPTVVAARFGGFAPQPAPLKVHDVGAFEASFVPGLADFSRLDARFRLPQTAWDDLPLYHDYGFAVFKLKAAQSLATIHPMAFQFPRRDPSRLFFPTTHVHDGTVWLHADFDHALYCQTPKNLPRRSWSPVRPDAGRNEPPGWDTTTALSSYMAVSRTEGIVDGAIKAHRCIMKGRFPNRDVWVDVA